MALFKALTMALEGVLLKSMGANWASAYPKISNSGDNPRDWSPLSFIKIKEHAPSFSLLAFAEVMVPFGKSLLVTF